MSRDKHAQNFDGWAVAHLPVANTKATIAKAAGGAGIKHVVTSITAVLAAGASAPTAVNASVSLIEDAAGTPVTHWGATMSLAAVAGEMRSITLDNLEIVIPANKSVTLEFSAAGGANTHESVAMSGYSTKV